MLKYPVPRWYQELSIPQMKRVFAIGKIIKCDHDETVTGRTQRILREIGITSTFIKISSKDLKKCFKISKLDPGEFLCEIYRYITGNYFENEIYKKFYDCNERIVLSAIAFLMLSETILELHRRLPMGKTIKYPKKPQRTKQQPQHHSKSPYLQQVSKQNTWTLYRGELDKWRNRVNSIVKPLTLLPITNQYNDNNNHDNDNMKRLLNTNKLNSNGQSHKRKIVKQKSIENNVGDMKKSNESVTKIKELTHADDFNDYVSGVDLYMSNRGKKFYPPGRENLSRKWQCWLHHRDIEYQQLANEADYILDNVRETIKLIFNPDICDNNCACRQLKINKIKKFETKIPHLIIDSATLDNDKYKNIIGSLTLNSPTLSHTDSFLNRPQRIPSENKIVKKKIIYGITTDKNGMNNYIISDIVKDIEHIPESTKYLSVPIKNNPPCNCKEYDEIDHLYDINSCTVDGVCIAKICKSNEFSHCKHCTDEQSINKIYRDFEKACKERENLKQQLQVPIDHVTCTQRLYHENKIKVEIENKPNVCTKCNNTLGKCQANPFIKIINQINEEKLLNRPKVSKKSEIKEYRDNIKLSVGGMTTNNSSDNKIANYILSGIELHTPITITPVSSSSSSSESHLPNTSADQHYHWSVTALTSQPETIKLKKSITHHINDKIMNNWNDHVNKALKELSGQVQQLDLLKDNLDDQLINDNDKMISVLMENNDNNDDKANKSDMRVEREKGGGNIDVIENDDMIKKKKLENEPDLSQLMKIALREMADEGFLLAKLPDCHKIPQLQVWIMLREGFVITKKQKSEFSAKTQQLWNNVEPSDPSRITPPSISILKRQRETLTRGDIHKIEQVVKHKQKMFYSNVRKLRVLESRAVWNLMDYHMFPSLAFKQAYFVYQASKESDGHIERPYGFSRIS